LVGDSITYGVGKDKANYPERFAEMLGDDQKYTVYNFGKNGRTMMKDGDYPYWIDPAYQNALASKADVIILMLGTNDSKPFQWNRDKYFADYISMVQSFQAMVPAPEIFLMIPWPWYFKDSTMSYDVINSSLPSLIYNIAKEVGIPSTHIIDLFTLMGSKDKTEKGTDIFADGCHPNDDGYEIMA
jgi:lysophospholipase L1-like esterase